MLTLALFVGELWNELILYGALIVGAVAVAALLFLVVRLATFGRVPPDADSLLSERLNRAAVYWIVIKFGALTASICAFIAVAVVLVLGQPVARFVEAVVFVILMMVLTDGIFGTAVNISLIRRARMARSQADTNI